MSCDDAVLGGVLARLLACSRASGPAQLPGLVREAARGLGADGARVFLADVQQRHLVPLPGSEVGAEAGAETEAVAGNGAASGGGAGAGGRDDGAGRAPGRQVDIEGTLGGRAYRLQQTQLSSGSPAVGWFPLVDGVERIGALRIEGGARDGRTVESFEALAPLVALLVVSKSAYSDVIVEAGRREPMSLQAELLWAFLPPRTIGTREVTSSAVLEPAYDVGGDAFDHAMAGGRLHVSVFDAMGHDLASGGASSVALAACRSTRRAGGGLADITRTIDRALARWIPDRLMTAVVADLDTATGELSWVNCGHPPPLLIRDRRVVPDALRRRAELPLGLGFHEHGPQPVHHARLQPGDRVLVYTDGVTEARSTSGELFGERRLTDTLVQHMAGGEPAPEALRHLIHALVTHQDHQLRDDATILLAEWHPHRRGP
ncbi:PP2C family protein-serine/threonine phosphatase [Streptomyces sp. NRRL S-350]|uniref:PP2C family protein-serine/threonine phosphatase n=1 Tax=Streptomyces sp. NRRL S-350 TaxID=1463902 RepID=UPI0004BF8B22|nr:PP2C family protein-serine/threonine phosphatase [Streptomyces sp. NRRL S-350]